MSTVDVVVVKGDKVSKKGSTITGTKPLPFAKSMVSMALNSSNFY